MIDPRRVPIRASPGEDGSDSSRDGVRPPGGIVSVLAFVLMVALVGWRWHDGAAAIPVHFDEIPTPHLLVLVQAGDCPDRRAALDQWLALSRDQRGSHGFAVSTVSLDGHRPDGPIGTLPMLNPEELSGVTRALLRFGVAASPAILAVDERGYPTFAVEIDASGPDAPNRVAHQALRALLHSTPNTGETLEWNR